jgi:hypothetical protein
VREIQEPSHVINESNDRGKITVIGMVVNLKTVRPKKVLFYAKFHLSTQSYTAVRQDNA